MRRWIGPAVAFAMSAVSAQALAQGGIWQSLEEWKTISDALPKVEISVTYVCAFYKVGALEPKNMAVGRLNILDAYGAFKHVYLELPSVDGYRGAVESRIVRSQAGDKPQLSLHIATPEAPEMFDSKTVELPLRDERGYITLSSEGSVTDVPLVTHTLKGADASYRILCAVQ